MRHPLWCLLLALPLAGGCNSDSTAAPSNSAELRIINASPDGPVLDVYVSGGLAADSLPYTFANPYVFVQPGSADIQVRAHNAINQLLDHPVTLVVDSSYTFVVAGTAASLTQLLLTDDTTAAASGNFKLRMVNLAPLGPAMDLYVTGPTDDLTAATPTVAGISYLGVSAYVTPPIGNARLRVTQAGTKTVLVDSGTLSFVTGQVATLFVVGKAGTGGGGAPYSGQLLSP